MTKKLQRFKNLSVVLVGSVLAATIGVAAWASNAPYESRLTVTFTNSETGSGGSRTVSYSATIVDSGAGLTTSAPVGSQIRVMGMIVFMCATQQPPSSVGHNPPPGCTFFSGLSSGNSGSASSRDYFRTYAGSNFDSNIANYPFITPTIHFQDAAGNQLGIHGNSTNAPASQTPASKPSPSRYDGPEIMAVDNFRPIVSGGKLTFTGKNLAAVTSATIGDKSVALSFDDATGLTIATPAGLAPGEYDLVMQSSFGKLTHLNAVTIKAPTPTQTTAFKGEGEYLNEAQVAQLVAFNASLNADYEKVRCIVNAADAEVAKAIAVRVCAHVARGEARNVEVIQDVRSTFKGSGFWVRVYAAG